MSRIQDQEAWDEYTADCYAEAAAGRVAAVSVAVCRGRGDILATGFGGYIALPLMREKYRPDMEEGEARALLEDCLRILFYRDCRALNRVQIAKVTKEGGVLVSDPYELDTFWDFKEFVTPKGAMGTDGGW